MADWSPGRATEPRIRCMVGVRRRIPGRIDTMSSGSVREAASGETTLLGDRRMPTKGERQRQAILSSLTTLLATRPIGDLSVGEIAAEAGVRRSGYYFYFESKYTALAIITSEIWSELMDRARSFVRFEDETVADFLDRTAGTAVETWHAHDAVLVASIQAIPLDEQLASMWKTWNERLAAILTAQVLKDQERGLAHPVAADLPALISTLLEMTMHMFYEDRLNNCTEIQTRKMLDTVRAIWLASAWGITPGTA